MVVFYCSAQKMTKCQSFKEINQSTLTDPTQQLEQLKYFMPKKYCLAHWMLIFCVEELHNKLRRKAQNSDFHWGPLQGEKGLLK